MAFTLQEQSYLRNYREDIPGPLSRAARVFSIKFQRVVTTTELAEFMVDEVFGPRTICPIDGIGLDSKI